jgi:nitroreductase
MVDIIEAIIMRKSIRDFKPDTVPKKILKEILDTAIRAPSAENSQPWEFTIIAGDVLDTIRQANVEKLNSGAPAHPDLQTKELPPDSIYRRRQIEIAKQIGNAVPPLLAARVADIVRVLLDSRDEI